MPSDDKQGSSNLASNGLVIAALIASGIYFFHNESPLVGTRPPITEINIDDPGDKRNKTVDARLWQDPFAALGKSLDKSEKEQLRGQCKEHPSEELCVSPLARAGRAAEDQNMLILGVMMTDAPYAEDSEQRRRTRYAVLAGLERKGFAPEDARHLLYFVWIQDNKQPLIVPYERFKNHNLGKSIIVLWLKEDTFMNEDTFINKVPDRGKPVEKVAELNRFLFHGSPFSARNQRTSGSLDSNWFVVLGPSSSRVLHEMVKDLALCRSGGSGCSERIANIADRHDNKKFRFYSYSANASDELLLTDQVPAQQEEEPCREVKANKSTLSIKSAFLEAGVLIERPLSTDRWLSQTMACELKKRLVFNELIHNKITERNVVLISEWDTLYAQFLVRDMKSQLLQVFESGDNKFRLNIEVLTYLRGLDGQLPARKKKDTENPEDNTDKPAMPTALQDTKENSAASFFNTQATYDRSDRPVGQGQFDYLRRISDHLRYLDNEIRLKMDGARIDAIGILGSDVFDKLLILRALRTEFPEAQFFTTGFDEAFTMRSERPWTRNLIVSSSFGPKLSPRYQGQIPPFRDARQTQAFLATQLAIDDVMLATAGEKVRNEWKKDAEGLREEVAGPRIFEIERDGHPLPLVAPVPKDAPEFNDCPKKGSAQMGGAPQRKSTTPTDSPKKGSAQAGGAPQRKSTTPSDSPKKGSAQTGGAPVLDVQGQSSDISNECNQEEGREYLYPRYKSNSRHFFVLGVALLACAAAAALRTAWVRKVAKIEVCIIYAALLLGVGISTNWYGFASWLTEDGEGEPFILLGGVSIWPTVLLRIIAIVVAVYFIWLSYSWLAQNLVDISHSNGLVPTDASSRNDPKRRFSSWEKIKGAFDLSLVSYNVDPGPSLEIKPIWDAYVQQERFTRRMCRVIVYIVVMSCIMFLFIQPMFGRSSIPSRGELAYDFYVSTVVLDFILVQTVIFFVFDATLLCLLFVRQLRRQSEWPAETMSRFGDALKMPPVGIVNDWIDLDFVGQRTCCVGSLVYFPFVLIALLVISRSTMFANFAPSLTILVTQVICLAFVFASSIMLWWVATTVRDSTKENLVNRIISAKAGASENNGYAKQLEVLLVRVEQLKEGTFRPILQQPLVRAALLPLGSLGWAFLIEKGMFPGL